jgi:hypothetical protein
MQKSLIDIWKKSWEDSGFEAIILNAREAEKSPILAEFVFKLQMLHKAITQKHITRYGLACYLRWLAYSTQKDDEPFFVSDYDVISKGFTPKNINLDKDKLSFLDRFCPCFAYGSKNNFLNLCQDICSISLNYTDKIKEDFQKNKLSCYHDQEFLLLNHQRLDDKYEIYPARELIKAYEFDPDCKNDLFHFSHRSILEFKQKFPQYSQINSDELRIEVIKQALSQKNSLH